MPLARDWKIIAVLCAWVVVIYSTSSFFPDGDASESTPQSQLKRPPVKERAEAAKEAFLHGWDAYLRYAFPNDDLKPLSKTFQNTRSRWGATVVDSLTTAIMMDMPDVVETMLEHIKDIQFAETNQSISLFGSTIRYLGPLLSAHDLLTGPSSHLDPEGQHAKMLLAQAKSLGTTLSFAFDTSSNIPQNNLEVKPKPRRKKTQANDITAAGTLALEWSHLGALTDDSSLSTPALKALAKILSKPHDPTIPFPGLTGRFLDVETGDFIDNEGGWYGGAGGYYEYLLKLYLHSPKRFSYCLDRWIQAADSTMKYLASHPASRPDLTFLSSYNGSELLYKSDHTAHFAAANFLLGGSVLKQKKYIDFGLKLVDSQIEMYSATTTGIAPDTYGWLPSHCAQYQRVLESPEFRYEEGRHDNVVPKECHIPEPYANQTAFLASSGYYIISPIYMLRPEVLESCYYAYRITGKKRYRNASWDIFQRILEHTKINSGGFAELSDVNRIPNKVAARKEAVLKVQGVKSKKRPKGGMVDRMYSFMLAEVVKYAWLVQVDDDEEGMPWHVRADGENGWVFNTEAHPLRVWS